MEEDANVDFELSYLVSNIKKEVVGVFDTFLSFLKEYEEKNPKLCFPWCWTLSLRPFV
jgi:hypothetical protein